MTWAHHILSVYKNLQPPQPLPNGVEWLYPQQHREVLDVMEAFCTKFYNDQKERTLLIGINPGRFGAGVTGVNFTAPRQVSAYLGLKHPFRDQTELSAEFMYDMITAYGGVRKFYSRFFMGSVCPLGFVQQGKNINYYDDRALLQTVTPFIVDSLDKLVSYNTNRDHCICIGGEKNYRHLSALNEKHQWFKTIYTVPHPRFIMQYKRKLKDSFIEQYLDVLKKK